MDVSVQVEGERANSPFIHILFYLDPHELGDAHSHWGGPSTLLSIQITTVPETPSQPQPEIMFNQLSGHLMIQST